MRPDLYNFLIDFCHIREKFEILKKSSSIFFTQNILYRKIPHISQGNHNINHPSTVDFREKIFLSQFLKTKLCQ